MPDDGRHSPDMLDNDKKTHAEGHQMGHRGSHRKPRHLRLIGIVVLLLAIVAAAWGIISRQQSEQALATWTDKQAVPTVAIVHPTHDTHGRNLVLPGNVDAYYEAPIYARVSGYLRMWYKDIGAHVHRGDVLATIETPDLDEQLAQADADLATAQAKLNYAQLTASRWHALLKSNSFSQQSADEKEGDALARAAEVNAARANVNRLKALENFKKLTAPFDGVVTARNTDIGALINAGSGNPQPLFKVADTHEMRVYVRVPQAFAGALTPGLHATLTEPQYPGKTFPATLDTTAFAAQTESRTVLAELLAPNPDGKLWTGTYADVSFDLPADTEVLTVPANALIFRAHGAELATVVDNHIVMKPVTIGRNLGNIIEIESGVTPKDDVVVSPPDTLEDKETVALAKD